MKTTALNTFISFENDIIFSSNEQFQSLVNSLAEGLDEEFFIAIFGVCSTYYTGYAMFPPVSGDLSREGAITEMALDHHADGVIVVHLVNSPSSLMQETRHLNSISNHLAENMVHCLDYCVLKEGNLTSFVDTEI